MQRTSHPLDGISLAWWPTLLQNSPAQTEVSTSATINENDRFTALLNNLANALTCAESCDLEEEITLP
jgi:hypothetical protein